MSYDCYIYITWRWRDYTHLPGHHQFPVDQSQPDWSLHMELVPYSSHVLQLLILLQPSCGPVGAEEVLYYIYLPIIWCSCMCPGHPCSGECSTWHTHTHPGQQRTQPTENRQSLTPHRPVNNASTLTCDHCDIQLPRLHHHLLPHPHHLLLLHLHLLHLHLHLPLYHHLLLRILLHHLFTHS